MNEKFINAICIERLSDIEAAMAFNTEPEVVRAIIAGEMKRRGLARHELWKVLGTPSIVSMECSQAAGPLVGLGEALSDKQREIARLAAQGLSNKVIARQIGIAPQTVNTHIIQIKLKTGLGRSCFWVLLSSKESLEASENIVSALRKSKGEAND